MNKKIGTFKIESGEVMISDPCYDVDTWCNGTIEGVKKGKWNASVEKDKKDGRCMRLIAWHSDITMPDVSSYKWGMEDITVGVDSGQAGIFDIEHFKKDEDVTNVKRISNQEPICEDEPWYSICCDRTLNEIGAGVIPFGCVSSSGYGDGSYDCYAIRQRNTCVAIMIIFCDEEDNDKE